MTDLNKFVEWSKENPGCKIEIEIGGHEEKNAGRIKKIWVYSREMGVGQFVSSAAEINLKSELKERMEQARREVEEYYKTEGLKDARSCS